MPSRRGYSRRTNRQWNKVGEFVKKEKSLLEIMTDKVSMGWKQKTVAVAILKGDGETVPVTEVISYLGEEGRKYPNSCGQTAQKLLAPAASASER